MFVKMMHSIEFESQVDHTSIQQTIGDGWFGSTIII